MGAIKNEESIIIIAFPFNQFKGLWLINQEITNGEL